MTRRIEQVCSNLRRDVAQALRLPLHRVSVETALEVTSLKLNEVLLIADFPLELLCGALQTRSCMVRKQEDLVGRQRFEEEVPDLIVTLWCLADEGMADEANLIKADFIRQAQEAYSTLRSALTSSRMILVEDLDEPPPVHHGTLLSMLFARPLCLF